MSIQETLLYTTCALLFITLGTVALVSNPKNNSNRSFFAFSISIFFWITSLYFGYLFLRQQNYNLSLPVIKFAYGFSAIGVFFMSAFFYSFPRKIIEFSKRTEISLLIFALILFVICSFTPLVEKGHAMSDGIVVGEVFGPLYFLYTIFVLTNIIFSIGLGIYKLKFLENLEKKKLLIATLGIAASAFTVMLINVVLPIFGIWLFKQKGVVFSLLFLIPAFYSIQKHRFLHFSNLSLNFLNKLILFSVFLVTTFLSFIFLTGIFPAISTHVAGLSSAILGLGVFKLTEYFVPEFVSESFRKFRNTLTEFKSEIYFCDSYAKLQKFIEETFLINLNLTNAKFFVIREKYTELNIPVYIKDEFTEELKGHRKDALVTDEISFRKLKPETKKILSSAMNKLEAGLCVPLFSEKNLIGFFVLGYKEKREHYSAEEIGEILTIRKDLEIGLMNILLKLNLQEENNLMKAIVDKKTKELRKKLDEIKQLLGQQSDFIAVTAHEFRTPLAIAMFQLEEILESYKNPTGLADELKALDSSLDKLKFLTQRLFDVQQYDLDKVRLQKKKTDIRQFVKNIYSDFPAIMKEKGLEFAFKDNLKSLVFCDIDQPRIRQVLHNLLTNASKFTPKGGRVELILEEDRKDVLIKVSDTGKGIPDSFKKVVFDKFRTKGAGMGIGLGLYLCKKIIELHKGKIWAEDSPYGGAMFCVRLEKQFSYIIRKKRRGYIDLDQVARTASL